MEDNKSRTVLEIEALLGMETGHSFLLKVM